MPSGAAEVEEYRQCVHMTDINLTESLDQTLRQKKHWWQFHLNTGINGIFVRENLVEKTALSDVFSVFYLHKMTFYVVENVGVSFCISEFYLRSDG
jgi:hypothetical protein